MYRRSQRWMLIINNRFLSLYETKTNNYLLVSKNPSIFWTIMAILSSFLWTCDFFLFPFRILLFSFRFYYFSLKNPHFLVFRLIFYFLEVRNIIDTTARSYQSKSSGASFHFSIFHLWISLSFTNSTTFFYLWLILIIAECL
jgi:hypothetical protein